MCPHGTWSVASKVPLDMDMTTRRCCFLWGLVSLTEPRNVLSPWYCCDQTCNSPTTTDLRAESPGLSEMCIIFTWLSKDRSSIQGEQPCGDPVFGRQLPEVLLVTLPVFFTSYQVLCNGINTNLAAQSNMCFLFHIFCEAGVWAWLNCSGSPRAATECGLGLQSTGEGSPTAHIVPAASSPKKPLRNGERAEIIFTIC